MHKNAKRIIGKEQKKIKSKHKIINANSLRIITDASHADSNQG